MATLGTEKRVLNIKPEDNKKLAITD